MVGPYTRATASTSLQYVCKYVQRVLHMCKWTCEIYARPEHTHHLKAHTIASVILQYAGANMSADSYTCANGAAKYMLDLNTHTTYMYICIYIYIYIHIYIYI